MNISIIIVTYNSGKTLRDTLNSILKQTYCNYEVIIKDGGSKDNTLDICKEYKNKFNEKIKIISSKDTGIYDAMNQGFSEATGDIIGILNSDDFYTSNDVLENIALTFNRYTNIDAVYADVHYVRGDNIEKTVRYYHGGVFRPWLMRLGFMPAHPSFYCKREIYNRFKININPKEKDYRDYNIYFNPTYKIAADFEILLRMIFIGKIKTIYINKDLVTMRIGGISSAGYSSHRQINKEHFRAFKENRVYSNYFFISIRYFYKILEILYYYFFKR